MNSAPTNVARLRIDPVDTEDQDAGDDQRQAVEKQPPPVAGHALGGFARELVTEVRHGAGCDEHDGSFRTGLDWSQPAYGRVAS